jgi:hypothetical protein
MATTSSVSGIVMTVVLLLGLIGHFIGSEKKPK